MDELKQDFVAWSEATLRAVHTQGYRPPPVRQTYIPKPSKRELRPLGVPCVGDRVLQRSVADVLSAIYEQDFRSCSFGGRLGVGAHHALAILHEVIADKPVSRIYEADLRNFFGSLDHGWLLRFIRHEPLEEQVKQINQVLRGHYAYYGVASNLGSLQRVYYSVERYWRRMLSSRGQNGKVRWEVFLKIKCTYPLQLLKLSLPYTRLKQYTVL